MVRTRQFRQLIDREAQRVGLSLWRGHTPGCWLEGLVLAESGGDPRAMRYEPHQDRPGRRDQASDGDTPGRNDGLMEDDTSYGLVQIMGYNVRVLCGFHPGCPIRFEFLFEPETNLDLGLRLLCAELRVTGGDVDRALARYNGGPTGDDPREIHGEVVMRRQEYVERIARHADRVRADRAMQGGV